MNDPASMPPVLVAITGASGAPYAQRLIEVLLETGQPVDVVMSGAGAQVWAHETGRTADPYALTPAMLGFPEEAAAARLRCWACDDFFAPHASGSSVSRGMVICPCSGDTLSAVAHGAGGNLIRRAAEVHLKERRRLILVPRETPLSLIAIDNMHRVTQAGAVVLPASPGWYHHPRTLDDLVDFVVAKILTHLELRDVARRLVGLWNDAPSLCQDHDRT